MSVVLDTSALHAWLHEEPGAERVAEHFPETLMSCVSWSEVVQKSLAKSVNVDGMRKDVVALGLALEPLTAKQAEFAGLLWATFKNSECRLVIAPAWRSLQTNPFQCLPPAGRGKN